MSNATASLCAEPAPGTITDGQDCTVRSAAVCTVLKVLQRQLREVSEDVEQSVVGVCSGFGGMAQQAKSAVQSAQCALDSVHGASARDALAEMQRFVGTIVRQLNTSADRAEQLDLQFQQMLEGISHHHQSLAQTLSETKKTSAQLQSDVARAVMSMQFQDRVNQRISHVIQTLDLLLKRVESVVGAEAQTAADELSSAWLGEIAQSYTMQCERAALSQGESASGTSAASSDSSSEEAVFDVELF